MSEPNNIILFEEKLVRRVWDDEAGKWYFSVVDVCSVLTNQLTPRGATLYWGKLKQRLKYEDAQLLTICQQLKMRAADGKMRLTEG